MKVWMTLNGTEIPYKKLEDSHLVNIIKYVKRKAKELDGEIIRGGGYDMDDMWTEEGDEEDWLKEYDYKGLLREYNKRGLKSKLK